MAATAGGLGALLAALHRRRRSAASRPPGPWAAEAAAAPETHWRAAAATGFPSSPSSSLPPSSYLARQFGDPRLPIEMSPVDAELFHRVPMTITNQINRMLDSPSVEGEKYPATMESDLALQLMYFNFRPDLVRDLLALREFIVPEVPPKAPAPAAPGPRAQSFALVTPFAGTQPFDDAHTITDAPFPALRSEGLEDEDTAVVSDLIRRALFKVMGVPRAADYPAVRAEEGLVRAQAEAQVALAPHRWQTADRRGWSEAVHLVMTALCPVLYSVDLSRGADPLHVVLPEALEEDQDVLELYLQERVRGTQIRPGMYRLVWRLIRQTLPLQAVGDEDIDALVMAYYELALHWAFEANHFTLKRGFRDAARRLARMQLDVPWDVKADLSRRGMVVGPLAEWSSLNRPPPADALRGRHVVVFALLDTPWAMGRLADPERFPNQLTEIVRRTQHCKSLSVVGVSLNADDKAPAQAQAFLDGCLADAQATVRRELEAAAEAPQLAKAVAPAQARAKAKPLDPPSSP